MTTKTLDEVMRRILNDTDIFSPPYDKHAKSALPLLFKTEEWRQLKEAFGKRDKDSFNSIVDNQCQKLQVNEQNARGWREKKIKDTIALGVSLKRAYDQKPYLLEQMLDKLDSFGIIECILPKMENYGKVIENYNQSIVEQYFFSSIGKVSGHQKFALRKALEYVKELYAMNRDILEIAFFIRKLNTLTQFMEVIKDE